MVIESQMTCHLFPLLVKPLSFIFANIFEQIVTSFRATGSSYSLSYHFSSLIVNHTLLSHFLMAITGILVHLLSFCYSITVTKSTSSICMVCFLYRPSIGSLLGGLYYWRLCKLAWPHLAHAVHHAWVIDASSHVWSHFTNHFINSSEAFVTKEWIVREGVTWYCRVTNKFNTYSFSSFHPCFSSCYLPFDRSATRLVYDSKTCHQSNLLLSVLQSAFHYCLSHHHKHPRLESLFSDLRFGYGWRVILLSAEGPFWKINFDYYNQRISYMHGV